MKHFINQSHQWGEIKGSQATAEGRCQDKEGLGWFFCAQCSGHSDAHLGAGEWGK